MMRSIVVLPQPDGPTKTPTSPRRQRERDVAEHLERSAGGATIGFARDANVKQFGAANGMRVVQWVAPPVFRSPA